jgi:hypothetical protein
MTKPAPLNWYCPTCAALRPARRRWGVASTAIMACALLPLAYSGWGLLLLPFAWLLADSRSVRECAACGEHRIISARQKLRDLEARPSARLRE